MLRSVTAAIAGVGLAHTGCSADARPQLVLHVDTDAPLAGQLLDDTLSSDAAVDTLRVEVFSADLTTLIDERQFVLPDVADWPLSLGIASADGASSVVVRLRSWRGSFARQQDPPHEVILDRLVGLELPRDGVQHVGVRLSSECRGVYSSFAAPLATCLDAAHPEASIRAGVVELDAPPAASAAGSWVGARATPCAGAALPGRVCIPGGFGFLGDLDLLIDGGDEPRPLRPVIVAPFWIDEHEVTVAEFRAVASTITAPAPELHDPAHPIARFCTWLPTGDPQANLPLTCVSWETARQACAARGGVLPSEAQWEHAARGRGQRRSFAWGNEEPACCVASAARFEDGSCLFQGEGPEDVGSHPRSDGCGGLGDVSRDGVIDLAGSASEWCEDVYRPFDDACWASRGVVRDPLCAPPEGGDRAARGASWESGFAHLAAALRGSAVVSPTVGFRCVYRDTL
jgi:formylglycine-generating enzyme required for sulfatase activity